MHGSPTVRRWVSATEQHTDGPTVVASRSSWTQHGRHHQQNSELPSGKGRNMQTQEGEAGGNCTTGRRSGRTTSKATTLTQPVCPCNSATCTHTGYVAGSYAAAADAAELRDVLDERDWMDSRERMLPLRWVLCANLRMPFLLRAALTSSSGDGGAGAGPHTRTVLSRPAHVGGVRGEG